MKRLAHAVPIALEMLREIFDEAPYARYLQRQKMSSSPHAYDSFLQEKEAAAAKRIGCC